MLGLHWKDGRGDGAGMPWRPGITAAGLSSLGLPCPCCWGREGRGNGALSCLLVARENYSGSYPLGTDSRVSKWTSFIYIQIYIYIYIHTQCIYIYICICVYICVYIYTQYVYIYTLYIYIYIHTHTHTQYCVYCIYTLDLSCCFSAMALAEYVCRSSPQWHPFLYGWGFHPSTNFSISSTSLCHYPITCTDYV